MKAPVSDLRLLLFGAALLIFGGGLTFAVARWNSAATDRAFVEAAERAARHRPPPPGPPRFWAPVTGAQPPAPITAEIVRREASLPPPAAAVPQAPGDKPPAAPR
jgi:hypothetical protein